MASGYPTLPKQVLGSLAVGSVVKLDLDGVATEFLVVNQGMPSGLYDVSCNGTWLLMKEACELRCFYSNGTNDYGASTIHRYLNGELVGHFSPEIQACMRTVKIPYRPGTANTTVYSGAQGLAAKLFLLSGYELGYVTSTSNPMPVDGSLLQYFASPDAAERRKVIHRGAVTHSWARSPRTDTTGVWYINAAGTLSTSDVSTNTYCLRPALVLPPALLVQEDGRVTTEWERYPTLGSLPAGALVRDSQSCYDGQPVIWRVADQNHAGYPDGATTLIADHALAYQAFDGLESSSGDASRKQYGNNRYLYANLRQWLNSDAAAGQWYTAQHDKDTPPSGAYVLSGYNAYEHKAGFLAGFSQAFRAALLPTTLSATRSGVDGGEFDVMTDRVFLPSCTEMGVVGEVVCGVALPIFPDANARVCYPTPITAQTSAGSLSWATPYGYWLRDAYLGNSYRARTINAAGNTTIVNAYDGVTGVRPMCNLPDRIAVSSLPDENGVYDLFFSPPSTLSDLPVGALVLDPDSRFDGQPVLWRVADKGHAGYPDGAVTLIADRILSIKAFDAKEPANGDANRKLYGNNRYLYANLRQWLNTDEEAGIWYSNRHSADAPPAPDAVTYNDYELLEGFLHGFSEAFRAQLLETTLTVGRATVDGDATETVTDRVFLPSCTEMGLVGDAVCGTRFALFGADATRIAYPTEQAVVQSGYATTALDRSISWQYWLRDANKADSYRARTVTTAGSLSLTAANNGTWGVRPACNLPGGLRVQKADGSDGYQLAFVTPPATPVSLATALQQTVGSDYTVSWQPGDPSQTVTYRLERAVDAGAFAVVYEGAACSVTQKAPAGGAMAYRVCALDAAGTASGYATCAGVSLLTDLTGAIYGNRLGNGSFLTGGRLGLNVTVGTTAPAHPAAYATIWVQVGDTPNAGRLAGGSYALPGQAVSQILVGYDLPQAPRVGLLLIRLGRTDNFPLLDLSLDSGLCLSVRVAGVTLYTAAGWQHPVWHYWDGEKWVKMGGGEYRIYTRSASSILRCYGSDFQLRWAHDFQQYPVTAAGSYNHFYVDERTNELFIHQWHSNALVEFLVFALDTMRLKFRYGTGAGLSGYLMGISDLSADQNVLYAMMRTGSSGSNYKGNEVAFVRSEANPDQFTQLNFGTLTYYDQNVVLRDVSRDNIGVFGYYNSNYGYNLRFCTTAGTLLRSYYTYLLERPIVHFCPRTDRYYVRRKPDASGVDGIYYGTATADAVSDALTLLVRASDYDNFILLADGDLMCYRNEEATLYLARVAPDGTVRQTFHVTKPVAGTATLSLSPRGELFVSLPGKFYRMMDDHTLFDTGILPDDVQFGPCSINASPDDFVG